MIKKIYVSLFLTLSIITFAYFSPILAQFQVQPATESIMASPDYYPQPTSAPTANFLGQDHYYSVTFRGNGEAVVSAKVIFSNLSESTMSALTLRVPRVPAQDVVAYQVTREPQCIRYSNSPPVLYDSDIKYGAQPSLRITPEIYKPPVCEEYQEPDYYQYWYGNNSYQKAAVTLQSDSIMIDLPKPVKPNATASFIVYYRAFGYAKKDVFGTYNFNFESLKTEDRIRTLQIGISTDSDLYLKGANGTVNYGQTQQSMAPMAAGDSGVAFKNAQFDNFLNQIGQGTILKTASNLQPLDSYTVKGAYAESRMSLYGKQISVTILVIVVILAVLFFIGRMIYRRYKGRNQLPEKGKQIVSPTNSVGRIIGEVAGLSFVSSILVAGYTLVLIFVMSLMKVIITYEFEFIFSLFVMIISCAVYALLIFGPVIFMGMKRGFWRAFVTLAAIIGWLVIYFFIFVSVFVMYRVYPNSGYYNKPIPVMMDGMRGPGQE